MQNQNQKPASLADIRFAISSNWRDIEKYIDMLQQEILLLNEKLAKKPEVPKGPIKRGGK